MASFSASDIALTGFRVVRERPRAALIWAAAQLVFSGCMSVVMVVTIGPALTKTLALTPMERRDPTVALAAFEQLVPAYLLILLISLIFYAILLTAMNRAVLQPDASKFGYLRLGWDELRQLGLLLLATVVGLLVYIVVLIVLVLGLVVVASVTGGVAGNPGPRSAGAGLLVFLVCLGVLGAWIFVYVRLSLASAMTFATRRVDLFGSWGLTKGKFWALFGAYLIAAILSFVVLFLTVVIIFGLTAAFGGGLEGLSSILHPDMSSLGAYLTPARLASALISAIAAALIWPVVLTPPAAAYKALATD